MTQTIMCMSNDANGSEEVRHDKPVEESRKYDKSSKFSTSGKFATIREAAVYYICFVAYYEDKTKARGPENRVEKDHPEAGSVGLPYSFIARRLEEDFPEWERPDLTVKQKMKNLQWYTSAIQEGKIGNSRMVPRRRPISKWKNYKE